MERKDGSNFDSDTNKSNLSKDSDEFDLRKISAKLLDEEDLEYFENEIEDETKSNNFADENYIESKLNENVKNTYYENDAVNNSHSEKVVNAEPLNDSVFGEDEVISNFNNKNVGLSHDNIYNNNQNIIKSEKIVKEEKRIEPAAKKPSEISLNKILNEDPNKKNKKNKKGILKGIIIAIIAIILVGGFYAYSQFSKALKSDSIFKGVSVEGINVSEMTKADAKNHINDLILNGEKGSNLRLYVDDYSKDVSYYDLGVKYDIQKAVEEAYKIGRSGGFFSNIKEVMSVKKSPVNIEINKKYNIEKLDEIISAIAQDLDRDVVNAKINTAPGSGKFNIEGEKTGYTVLQDITKDKVKKAVDENISGDILIETEKIFPTVTAEDLSTIKDKLGSYSTSFSANAINRNTNLKVGSKNVNGTILMPGETFSMNVGLGPQTLEAGYKNAGVFVNGKVEDDIAGGVCQITTTLYNAVIRAELEIVQRNNHSLAVGYVQTGFDAAVAGTFKDLKFRNNTNYPIYIEQYVAGNNVYSNIYGTETRSPKRSINFERVYVRSIPQPPEKIIEDPTLKEGERVVEHKGKVGSVVNVYKLVYEGEKLVEKSLFSTSKYIATPDEIKLGTKKDTDANKSTSGQPSNATGGANSGNIANQNNNQDLIIGAN